MKTNIRFFLYLSTIYYLLSTAFMGCVSVPHSGIKAGYNFSKITTIGVGRFTAAGGSGDAVSGEFVRQFLRRGYNVKMSDKDVDVILEGSVDQYIPQKQYLVYSADNSNTVVVTPPVTEISGSNTYSLGTPLGLKDKGEVVVTNATIGVTARLVDVKTREIVWTNSYTYEGFDFQGAVESAVSYLVNSFAEGK